jgi:GAF domain-containing protein
MLTRIRQWLALPTFEGDEEKTDAATVLNTLSLIVFVGVALFAVANIVFGLAMSPLVMSIIAALLVVCIASFVLLRLGYVRFVGVVLSAVLWAGFTLPAIDAGGMHDTAVAGYFVVIILAGVAAGAWALVFFTLLSIASVAGLYIAEHLVLITPSIGIPSGLNDLILLVLLFGSAAVLLRYALRRTQGAYRRARRDAQALAESNLELETSRDALAAQTGALERRSRYLEATAAVARDTTLELDIRDLLPRLVNLVSEQLGFYHAGIFFLAPSGEWLELQAASSEGGQRMLGRGHRLRMGEGIVGYAAQEREPRIALSVGEDAVFFDNPDLPETRSEVALPLISRGELIGVLDVQSTEPQAFSDEDLAALQALANQLAVAISNARLFWEAQQALDAERRAYGEMSRAAWQDLARAEGDLSVLRDERGLSPLVEGPDFEVEQALRTGRSATGSDGGQGLAIPIRVRGQVIGAIDAHKPDDAGGWTAEQAAMMETLAEQLGDALEDARLYEDIQRRAARERTVQEISDRMQRSADMATLMQITVEELNRRLGGSRAYVRLSTEAQLMEDADQRSVGEGKPYG